MALVSQIIDEIRANVNEGDETPEKFYTNQEIINYVNRSLNDLCIDTDTNYSIEPLGIVGSSVGLITSINASATTNCYLAGHGLITNETVYICGITGTIGSIINDNYWVVTNIDADNFTVDKDTSDYAYTAGGTTVNMNYQYTFASINQNANTELLDMRFLIYREADWEEWLYDDLLKVTPKQNISYTSSENRRMTCNVERTTVILGKAPQVLDIIIVAGRWAPVQLTTSGDTYPLGIIEEDATIKYATSMCWLKKNKPEIAGVWMTLYGERKADLDKKLKRMTQFDYPSTLSVSKDNSGLLNLSARLPGTIST